MVEVPAVAVTVPPQEFVSPLGVLIMRPPGRTSEKLTPVKFVAPVAVLEIVKVKSLAPFTVTEAGLNDFEIVGTGGVEQPEIVTLSRKTVESVLFVCAPEKIILKYVVPALAGVEVLFETVPHAFLNELVAQAPVPL
jgi:hypothetical protein